MHLERSVTILRVALAAATTLTALTVGPEARAQATQQLAATDYLVEYMHHAHGYYEDAPIVPRMGEGTIWSGIHSALMQGRKAQGLYLIGDEDAHLFPTRVGILGWGFSMGVRF